MGSNGREKGEFWSVPLWVGTPCPNARVAEGGRATARRGGENGGSEARTQYARTARVLTTCVGDRVFRRRAVVRFTKTLDTSFSHTIHFTLCVFAGT